uniref:Uncharacterized protein n=1 Tax=Phyllymenia taiwanensis TaxID=1260292 RepID=R9XXS3_9FLOR|nr:hypothetical protein [Grateloupia taiwanensis]AGO19774.1 hypothetical protein [Grateloupia taiwanensis]
MFEFSILYSHINLFQRVIKLLFVASSNVLQSFINKCLFVIGLMYVIKKIHRFTHYHLTSP